MLMFWKRTRTDSYGDLEWGRREASRLINRRRQRRRSGRKPNHARKVEVRHDRK